MAVINDTGAGFILNLLKVFYEDGVENLMFRNDPLLAKVTKERVEGKAAHFAALYGRGGACGGNFTKASTIASQNEKSAEFQVTPGKLFSVYTVTSIELQAAKTLKGAYMPIAAAKMFAASEAFRKTIAMCLYGTGYGEICLLKYATADKADFAANAVVDIVIPESAAFKLDVGSRIQLKQKVTSQESDNTSAEVVAIGTTTSTGTTISIKINATPSFTWTDSSDLTNSYMVISLEGSMNGAEPLLPVGLNGWLPVVAGRTGNTWINAGGTGYINQSFMGVVRAVSPDRLAGAFYEESSNAAKSFEAVENVLRMCRAHGSLCDMVVMNDKDWQKISRDVQATNSFWTKTLDTAKGKKTANLGFNEMKFNFSTSWIENVYDTPYCPEGQFFILSSDSFRLWSYYSAEVMNDGIAAGEPGKPNPTNAEEVADKPRQLLISDYITLDQGKDSIDGPVSRITLNFAGAFVIKNPSNAGVGLLYQDTATEEFRLAVPTYSFY